MHYYRGSSEEADRSSTFRFALVVFSVAVIVVRAVQLVGGLDFSSTADKLNSIFH